MEHGIKKAASNLTMLKQERLPLFSFNECLILPQQHRLTYDGAVSLPKLLPWSTAHPSATNMINHENKGITDLHNPWLL